MTEKIETRGFVDMLFRAVSIIGLVAVLLLGAWGVIQVAFNLPGILSGATSNFGSFLTPSFGREALLVETPNFTVSGEQVLVTWEHKNHPSGAYAYQLSYACDESITLTAPTEAGKQPVPCDTVFNYTNATSSISLIPTLVGISQQDLTLIVTAVSLADGSQAITGSTTLTVLPARGSAHTNQTGETNSSTQTPVTLPIPSRPKPEMPANAMSDLAVHILSTRPQGNGYTEITFEIANIGNKTTPSGWSFNVTIPFSNNHIYNSPAQHSLKPGDKTLNTMTIQSTEFAGQPIVGTVYVTADPAGTITERSKSNNTASVQVTVQ